MYTRGIFYILLAIIQIILLLKCIKHKNNKNFLMLFSFIILSIISIVLLFYYYYYNSNLQQPSEFFIYLFLNNTINYVAPIFESLAFIMLNICAIVIYSIILIIGIILKLIYNKKQNIIINKLDKKTIIKIGVISFIIVLSAFVIGLLLAYIPYTNNKKIEDEAQKYVLNYLNQNYGNLNFEIVDIYSGGIYTNSTDLSAIGTIFSTLSNREYVGEGFNFTIHTDYMIDNFTIIILKDDFTIYKDEFKKNNKN